MGYFDSAELGRSVSLEEYKKEVPSLRVELLRAQNKLRAKPTFSVVVLVAGIDAAGKGETINTLHEWMDPRYLRAHAFGPPTQEESERPPVWRYWRAMPPAGRIATFFGSWYTDPLLAHIAGETSEAELKASVDDINDFEKLLASNGTLILKFWFHLSKDGQRERLEHLSSDPEQSWRVTETDWRHLALHERFVEIGGRVVAGTSTTQAPWMVIEGSDKHYRELAVARALLEALRHHRKKVRKPRKRPKPPSLSEAQERRKSGELSLLGRVDLTQSLDKERYAIEIERAMGRLARLSRAARREGRSAIAVFEGWDAAGKGGAIRRATRALDSRYYEVIPIAVPSDEELAHHYLWRFVRHLPRAGHLTIFDRSWYGRVLVERVEGFARVDEWKRAYEEINIFERELSQGGIRIAKFWLHIDEKEQLRRFKEREKIPYKNYKITADDYRNRERWPLYEEAVEEMLERTDSPWAKWTLVAANDKRHARIRVLDRLGDLLEDQDLS